MAIWNLTGFETGDTSEAYQVTVTGVPTYGVQSSVVRSGNYAFHVDTATEVAGVVSYDLLNPAATGVVGNGDSQYATGYYRFYFRYNRKPSTTYEYFAVIWGTGINIKFGLGLTSSGTVQANDSAHSTLATGSTVLTVDTWYLIEIKCATGTSGAAWEVKINGTVEISGTGNLSNTNNIGIGIGKSYNRNSKSIHWYYDDVAMSNTGYIGAGSVLALSPNASGSSSQWTGSYTDVTTNNGDTSYISVASNNQISLFNIQDTTGTLLNPTVNAVKVVTVSKHTGVASSIIVRGRLSSTNNSTTATNPGASYFHLCKVWSTNFVTTSAWQLSDLDALEVGVVSASANGLRCTYIAVMVDTAEVPNLKLVSLGNYAMVGNSATLTKPPAEDNGTAATNLILVADASNRNICLQQLTGSVRVSGQVTNVSGSILASLTINFFGSSGFSNYSASTDSFGNYHILLPDGWTGTVRSGDPDKTLRPDISYTKLTVDTRQDYVWRRTWVVATDGANANTGTYASPYKRLVDALNAVGAGETIYIRGGTYTLVAPAGDYGIDSWHRLSPTASGTSGNEIILESYIGETALITSPTYAPDRFMYFRKENAYWTVRRLTMTGCSIFFDFDVFSGYSISPHHILCEDLTLSDTQNDSKAFRVKQLSNNLTFRRCEMHHISGPGCLVSDSSHDILFEDCSSHDNDDGRGTDGDADGFTIDDFLTGEGNSTNQWPYNITLRRCFAYNNAEDGFDIKADNVLIDSCISYNNEADCFKLWAIYNARLGSPVGVSQTTMVMTNCLGYNSGESVIEFEYGPHITLLNNTFIQTRPGYAAHGEETLIFVGVDNTIPWTGYLYSRNNIFVHLGIDDGLQGHGDHTVRAAYMLVYRWTLDMDYDIFSTPNITNETVIIVQDIARTTYHIYPTSEVNSGNLYTLANIEQHTSANLPSFVNSSSNDYRLTSSDTVCRDTGTNATAVSTETQHDLRLINRPQGSGYDRGCYEQV